MPILIIVICLLVVALIGLALSLRIVKQYEQGVLFRLGRVIGVRPPGLTFIIPFVDDLRRVSLRIVTMPIQSQGIITRDNVSVDVSAVAYYRVVDAVKSVVAIENVADAINQIAQTTLRKVVGQHTLDETLSETDRINVSIREILDIQTAEWGVVITLVELKDIQPPESMNRAIARQAEAEREKRAVVEIEAVVALAISVVDPRQQRPGPPDHVGGPWRRPRHPRPASTPPALSVTGVGAVQVCRRRADDRHLGPDALASRSRDRAPRRRERIDDPQSAAADLVSAYPALDRDTRTVVVDLDADAAVVDLQPQGDPGPAGVGRVRQQLGHHDAGLVDELLISRPVLGPH
jgi:hypothetical protein